jgi:hypothetical protein
MLASADVRVVTFTSKLSCQTNFPMSLACNVVWRGQRHIDLDKKYTQPFHEVNIVKELMFSE